MTIGTAKPTTEELSVVKHYFVDDFPIQQNISAADFERLALNYLEEIFIENDAAIVCGGTGLYIKALLDGLDEMPEINAAIEIEINEEYQKNGLTWLQENLKKEDPLFFEIGEIQNPARLLRALIFKLSTGESITTFRTAAKKQRPFKVIKIGLELPRAILYERINHRVDEMMEAGLSEEAKKLYPYKALKNLQTVGYSELFDYFDGKWTLQEAISKIKQHTRNYAKRQLTWFKKDKEFVWLDARDENVIEKILELR